MLCCIGRESTGKYHLQNLCRPRGPCLSNEPYIFNFMDRLNRALNPSVFLTLFPFVVPSVVFLNKCQRTPHRTILYLDQDLDEFIFPFAIIEGTRERVARGLLFGATRELSATGQEQKFTADRLPSRVLSRACKILCLDSFVMETFLSFGAGDACEVLQYHFAIEKQLCQMEHGVLQVKQACSGLTGLPTSCSKQK